MDKSNWSNPDKLNKENKEENTASEMPYFIAQNIICALRIQNIFKGPKNLLVKEKSREYRQMKENTKGENSKARERKISSTRDSEKQYLNPEAISE